MGFRRDPNAVKGRKIERALLRRVLKLARPYRAMLIAFLVGIVLDAIVTAIQPLLLRSLLDTAIPDKNRTLVWILGGTAVFLVLTDAGSAWPSGTSRPGSAKA